MSEHQITDYGEYWAPYYDDIFAEVDHEVGLLAPLAGEPARALELAVGTGRVAIPLSQAGVEVTGIEISDEMIARLQEKPGGEAITVIKGDFATVEVDETFPLIYLPFNTLFALTSQERQLECFQNVARALEPGGRFVLDTFFPDVKRFDQFNTRMAVSAITSDQAHSYELSVHHPLEQRVNSHMVRRMDDGSTVVLPVTIRYAWPSEMDLMAQVAGLTLENRWGWYDKRPYTESTGQYVSVYRKP
jgi:SAM-dependent methyltransferase